MKTIRIYLMLFAIVASVGGAVASSTLITPVFEFIDLPGTEDDECKPITLQCEFNLPYPCKVNSAPTTPILRELNQVATQCGRELTRDTAPPLE